MNTDMNVTYYYILNKNVEMTPGKKAAQVSHIAMQLASVKGVLGRAIICEASQSELEFFLTFPDSKRIHDAGLNEIPRGTLTCVGLVVPTSLKIKELRELPMLR
jgi:peptidyl-tRNA hydrolase